MKIIDIPQSGRLGTFISFNTPHGLVRRPYVVPRDPRTDKQLANRARWAEVVVRWQQLTEVQRCVWRDEASGVRSHGRLGDKGYLSGFQLFMKINTNLAHLGLPWADNPPNRPQFSDSPVGQLAITHTAGVTALKLAVAAALKHLTLVWATAPASPGNSCPGRFIYLGILPAPLAGASDITQLYLAVYAPRQRPGLHPNHPDTRRLAKLPPPDHRPGPRGLNSLAYSPHELEVLAWSQLLNQGHALNRLR